MPRRKRASSPFDPFDDDFDEDASSQSSKNGNPPVQRNAANARERARMRVLSSAFGRLKTKLPNIPPDTKLSKLDTLRLATMYIKQLKVLVEGGATNAEHHEVFQETAGIFNMQSVSQSMTWPFGFHQMQASNNNSANGRLQTLQYSPPAEWNHLRNTYSKYGRISNGDNNNCTASNYQQELSILQSHQHPHQHQHQHPHQHQHQNHWYATDEPMVEDINVNNNNNNNNCAFFEQQSEQHMKHNHDVTHTQTQLYHASQAHATSSIR
ncbi:putative uncharacterized protein DDB_G0267716 [Ceratitis capitata]|uniref:putative uncharacterized protein DDB_G0267716 n=1 Tax=Ceratitis capitata TaxID=7213 RepID=UPI000329729E|nr:putative uncharacterized protein DDB_G0267716 [Ceratitis capitata]